MTEGTDAASTPPGPVSMDADRITRTTRRPHETAEHLQRWLAHTLGPGREPVITELSSPESNGMSSETLLFTARWHDDGEPTERRLVARIEPPSTAYPLFPTYDLGMQFRVLRLVGEHTAVPVPETLWYEDDPAVLGGPFFVMAQVDGLVPPMSCPTRSRTTGSSTPSPPTADDSNVRPSPPWPVSTPSPRTASISTSWPGPVDRGAPGGSSLLGLVRQWKDYCDWVVQDAPSPLLTECFAWLEAHEPSSVGGDALSWGDGRIGNMMFRDFEVVAVLDWEMASVAPPEVDLGWLCYLHRFFHDIATDLGAEGLPDLFRPVDVATTYAEVSGYRPADLRWFMAFAAVRHGAIMRRVTERAIFFGEADRPDDIDDLILHRASLRGMLDGSYWDGLAF